MVTDYGAFIKIPGCRKQGLVHRTHMSSCRVDKPSEIVDVGDKVWVKLIGREMKNDRIKVSLSMKVVNQGTGKDLDPNNVIIEKRRKRNIETGSPLTLTAQTLRVIQARGQGARRKTVKQRRRRRRRRSIRRSTRSESRKSGGVVEWIGSQSLGTEALAPGRTNENAAPTH
ncbi:nucleolar protein of 40 kDa isoform X7 [Tupaia chinensis]|uniref:nucleolar protein of 40 kDa isoform X7 n=1 Tax=Tupaia chinensis TaxID=246437 RepID=UPI000FFB089F|nr:nucleolar protein of 40 kDa isoform X7 [Tupaia chinensis]